VEWVVGGWVLICTFGNLKRSGKSVASCARGVQLVCVGYRRSEREKAPLYLKS
jgi:hypothetical protein